MKQIQKFTLIAFASALLAISAFADQANCCKEAKDAKKTCTHKCCVAAARKGQECEKCGGKGEITKAKDAKKADKKS
ncbi:MAG: hypothetical protein JWQ71_810 [Pedosphaera sp.]|nr:hypothetical protein [Pedosphaera sp.]